MVAVEGELLRKTGVAVQAAPGQRCCQAQAQQYGHDLARPALHSHRRRQCPPAAHQPTVPPAPRPVTPHQPSARALHRAAPSPPPARLASSSGPPRAWPSPRPDSAPYPRWLRPRLDCHPSPISYSNFRPRPGSAPVSDSSLELDKSLFQLAPRDASLPRVPPRPYWLLPIHSASRMRKGLAPPFNRTSPANEQRLS